MKEKNYFLLLTIIVCLFASCSSEKDLYVEEVPDVSIENYKFTKDFTVPVEPGKTTVVTYNGETIFEGNVSVTIQVPKINTSNTRVYTGLDWHFVPNNNANTWWYDIYRTGILMFEDIPGGDNDYNDFVCYFVDKFEVNVDGNTGLINTSTSPHPTGLQFSELGIYPKAMGNTIPLKFGIEIVRLDNNELIDDIIIYDDIREEAFGGATGFINTDPSIEAFKLNNANNYNFGGEKSRRYYPSNLGKNAFAINYYIIANGVKHYTADSSKAVATNNGTPFGLCIPSATTFDYPQEKVSIFNAYPKFTGWLNGTEENPFAGGKENLLYKMPTH